MDLLHTKAIDAALEEMKIAGQQMQRATAAAEELIANANELVLRLLAAVEAMGKQSK